MKKEKNIEISIIIPVMNEEENIETLAEEVNDAMKNMTESWECIWIDDCSTDMTGNILKRLHKKYACHKYVFHKQNYGQSAALATGFKVASGEIFVTLDGDGQNDPASIPDLIKTLKKNNADMVNGWRQKRYDSFIRKISSRIANGVRNFATGEQIKDVGCALRAFKRECTYKIPVFKGMHRFFPTLARIAGYSKILEVPVKHRPRTKGKTKYGIHNRLWVGIIDIFGVNWIKYRFVYPEVQEDNIDN